MDKSTPKQPVEAPTRRRVIKTGTTAALALAASPAALAAARRRFPPSGEIVLTFDVASGSKGPASG